MLGGQVKPMITTCDMRHLYAAKPKNETLILQAKEYERRRCNHQDLEEPLSTLECLSSVVDPKDSHTNKNRYIVASNDVSVRKQMRRIAGVPLIYISKSVVLLEPMANASEEQREREEKSKFKLGLKGQRKSDVGGKRKRNTDGEDNELDVHSGTESATGEAKSSKKRRQKGPKEPNPLSIKKAKKDQPPTRSTAPKASKHARDHDVLVSATVSNTEDGEGDETAPRKRRRKHKSKAEPGAIADDEVASP